jgi:ribonuclease J
MINVIEASSKIGEITIPKDTIVDLDIIKNIPDRELVVISTGSQGEPMSALTRMSSGELKEVTVTKNDTIFISASPIPGNEKSIYQVINNLYKLGAEVYYESLEKIHASGHACQEELKIMHSLIKPKFFVPVHGEYRHLKKHIDLAKEMGMKEHNTLICEIGDTVDLTPKKMTRGERFQAGSRLVDGLSVGEAPNIVRDRKLISAEGIVVAVCCISSESGLMFKEPDIIGKGAGLTDSHIADMKNIILKTIDSYNLKYAGDKTDFRNTLRKKLRDYVYKKIKKNPMILPIITEV